MVPRLFGDRLAATLSLDAIDAARQFNAWGKRVKHFATFRFDDVDGTLWRGEQIVPMTRKAREVLACLVAAGGNWVSKNEILARVWPDTHVHPDNVKVLIHEIRLRLDDDSRQPQFVRSEPGRGYAFIAQTNDAPGPSTGLSVQPLAVSGNAELAALAETLTAVATILSDLLRSIMTRQYPRLNSKDLKRKTRGSAETGARMHAELLRLNARLAARTEYLAARRA